MNSEIKNLFRVGTVCDLKPEEQEVRVNFDELGTPSPWMQMPSFGADGDDYYWMPVIGEQVLCLLMPTGNAEGYVLRSIRGNDNKPKNPDNNKRYISFADGGLVQYDKGSNTLTIKAANIKIEGNIRLKGKMVSTGDVIAGGISLINHPHTGVMTGSGQTGKPV